MAFLLVLSKYIFNQLLALNGSTMHVATLTRSDRAMNLALLLLLEAIRTIFLLSVWQLT